MEHDAEIEKQIRDAWDASQYPGEDHICEACDHESNDIKRKFRHKNWLDCVGTRSPNAFDMVFFQREAFHYYLPAYLINCLRSGSDEAVKFLSPAENSASLQQRLEFDNRMTMLTREQRRALHDWLMRVRETPRRSDALDHMRFLGL